MAVLKLEITISEIEICSERAKEQNGNNRQNSHYEIIQVEEQRKKNRKQISRASMSTNIIFKCI